MLVYQSLFSCGLFKKILAGFLAALMLLLCGCGDTDQATSSSVPTQDESATVGSTQCETKETGKQTQIVYRYAAKSEGASLLLSNQKYYDGFSQNDLDYRMQKNHAGMEEYLSFVPEQVLDFTEDEKALIDSCFASMNKTLTEKGYTLSQLDEVVLIKTTMKEEADATAYTHGTQIYIGEYLLNETLSAEGEEKEEWIAIMYEVLWHELFHCLTRCNPDFQVKMYDLIHFTITDKDFTLPASVMEYHISNPDVEHHNSYATFRIDSKDVDCFVDWVTTKHFEKEGEIFFDFTTTALIPIDGTDIYYTPEQAENFDEVFGKNTDYVTDPEECMADNFAGAILYGVDGPDGKGYSSPDIIKGILAILKAK